MMQENQLENLEKLREIVSVMNWQAGRGRKKNDKASFRLGIVAQLAADANKVLDDIFKEIGHGE